MTIAERKEAILSKIAEMKANGENMETALNKLGVTLNESVD